MFCMEDPSGAFISHKSGKSLHQQEDEWEPNFE